MSLLEDIFTEIFLMKELVNKCWLRDLLNIFEYKLVMVAVVYSSICIKDI